MSAYTISKEIIYFTKQVILACDAKCDKAWGINTRQKNQLSEDPDDYEFLSDTELAVAPKNPGTYEGGQHKPCYVSELLNKWCCRECERSDMAPTLAEIKLPDFSERLRNK